MIGRPEPRSRRASGNQNSCVDAAGRARIPRTSNTWSRSAKVAADGGIGVRPNFRRGHGRSQQVSIGQSHNFVRRSDSGWDLGCGRPSAPYDKVRAQAISALARNDRSRELKDGSGSGPKPVHIWPPARTARTLEPKQRRGLGSATTTSGSCGVPGGPTPGKRDDEQIEIPD